jgi:hypothetical protein
MSKNQDGARLPTSEIPADHSTIGLASLVRNHLSSLPDWPIIESFVDCILFPVENKSIDTFLAVDNRSSAAVFKEAEDLVRARTVQDELMAVLTQGLVETRTRSNDVSSCMMEVLLQLDAKEVMLWHLETQNQCLQVDNHSHSRSSKHT